MAEQAKQEIKRVRNFGRIYNHDAGTVDINAAFDKDYKQTVALTAFPNKVLEGFALQGVADYVVGEMNDRLNNPEEGETPEETRAAALKVGEEAIKELMDGQVDFRTGVGLGGVRSAIGALGTVLFELGKKFVKNAKGETLSLSDIHTARDAVKKLYFDTDAVKVKDAQGKEREITGRMIFNAIAESPGVKEALAAKRKGKKPQTQGQNYVG